MGKPTGFKEFERKTEPYRDVSERLADYGEIYTKHDEEHLKTQVLVVWIAVYLFASLRMVVQSII